MAYASCGSDLPDIISLDTEDNNSVYSCESWEILAPLPQRVIPSTSRNARFTSKNEGHLYRTKDTRNVSDKVEEYLEKMTPALPPCEVCQLIESNATSRESLKFWRAVDETSTSETSCHVKYYVYFFKKLEESFPDEPGIKNRQVMNLLQTILRVEGKNDTRTVSLENFVQAVKYFGPVCTASKCCTFVSELEILCIKSLHYRHKHKKEKISWFAGFMTREDAEARLSSQKDSTYMVRISENTDQGGFVLSVKSNGSVHHFEITYYVYFFKKLEESFPDEPGIKNRQVMNLLQTILRVEGKNDTRTVSLENFVQAVKYFGPVCTASKCCTFVSELEILCIKSLHYRHKHKKEKISWFAGFMTREDAEARLSSQKDSTYMVRISENTDQGGFVLSVKSNGSVHHFEITSQLEVNAQGEHCCTKFLFNDTTYYNLAALVEGLMFAVISPEDEGIDIQCRTICPGLPLNSIITGYKKARTVKR